MNGNRPFVRNASKQSPEDRAWSSGLFAFWDNPTRAIARHCSLNDPLAA